MRIVGDVESINLSTGERFRRVSGEGESVLLSEAQLLAINDFEREMREVVIPEIVETMRRRARLAREFRGFLW